MISEATTVLRGENECHYSDKNPVIWVKNECRRGEHDTERDTGKKEEDEGLDAICGEQEKLCEITSTVDVQTFVWDMQRCLKVGAQHVKKVMLKVKSYVNAANFKKCERFMVLS